LASVDANAGEVWAADFSTAAKQRPVLVLAFPQPSDARASVVLGRLNDHQLESVKDAIRDLLGL